MRQPFLQDMQAYMQQSCVPCTKSELDLESMQPAVDWHHQWLPGAHWPGEWWTSEFLIPASGDYYLDLSHCYLYLKCRVLKTDSLPIETLKADASHGGDSSVEPAVPLPLQASGLGDERCPGAHEWRHLPLQGLPDDENIGLMTRWVMIANRLTSRVGSTRTCCCKSKAQRVLLRWQPGLKWTFSSRPQQHVASKTTNS